MIDYRTTDFTTAVSDVDEYVDEYVDVDVARDTLAGDVRGRPLEVLRAGGVLVTILPVGYEDDARRPVELGVRLEQMLVEADNAGMRTIAEPAEKGQLGPIPTRPFRWPGGRGARPRGDRPDDRGDRPDDRGDRPDDRGDRPDDQEDRSRGPLIPFGGFSRARGP
ncbi:hypothetical protein [Streptomyces sp. NPDC012510]|uniref:hypothetical protein n=1 Tax=Streptomyces sp. NPDC012510 TaxID=3364838 RepID=UPI0036E12646